MVVILFLGGVQLVCLGIIGEYLARTYNESKRRELYFVMEYRPAASAANHGALKTVPGGAAANDT